MLAGNPTPPSGTVTFLFTDIEGSTSLWERDPAAMQRAEARQEEIVRDAMAAHGGYVYKMIGDAFQVAFSTATTALAAAVAAQRALHAELWGSVGVLKVRMALHTGVTEERGDDYVGPDLNRIARLLSTGYGGQVLLSEATADLVRDHLPKEVALRDLGQHVLRDLVRPERVYEVVAQGLPKETRPLKTMSTRPRNLPTPATPFVGREDELAQIAALLHDPHCRLVSLVGLGGSGKTRLAIEAAARCADVADQRAFSGGVYFVSLAASTTSQGVLTTLADALGMPFYARPGTPMTVEAAQVQLLNYLAGKDVLLVLDNCEHLLAEEEVGFANLISILLATASRARLIATSRERLNLPGEWVLEVAGLSYPGSDEETTIPGYAAVQLFVKGAQRAGSFEAGTLDWPAIARICQLLGGMPLGVEMAASWTKVLTCQEIAADLGRDLLSLIAMWRTAPERHRTLRTVLDHSWRLLSEEERDAFCRLSVFRSGFGREAAAKVAGASLPLLSGLIDKSFVRRAPEGPGGPGRRFETHPALRQYAAEKLGVDPAAYIEARTRHAHYYVTWLGEMYEKLKGGEQLAALAALRAESQDLHDAWRWLIVQRDEERLRALLPGMILFHEIRGRTVEAQEMIDLLVDQLDTLGYVVGSGVHAASDVPDPALLALTLAALRHFSLDIRDPASTNPYQRHSIEIVSSLPDNREKAITLLLDCVGAGILSNRQSCALCQQVIGIFRRLGDPWGMSLAQLVLADAAGFHGEESELARLHYQASLEGFTRLGNEWGRALCLTGLSQLRRQAGELEEAFRLRCQALAIYTRLGDPWREVVMHHDLGEIAEEMGRFEEARRHYEANVAHFARMGDGPARDAYRERLQRLGERTGLVTASASARPDGVSEPADAASGGEAGVSQHAAAPMTGSRTGAAAAPDAEQPPVEPLSEREIEVLALLAEGLSNREIAGRLYLSPNTVRVHTHHIYGKLGVSNRTQAAAKGRALGLLPSS